MKKRRKASPASKAGARCLAKVLVNMGAAEDESDAGFRGGKSNVHRQCHRRTDTDSRAVDGSDDKLRFGDGLVGHH